MTRRGAGALACTALWLWAGMAGAMPGEMPWDHSGGPGRPDCTECHFDAGAVAQSKALTLQGLPEKAVSGRSYDLVLRLRTDGLQTAGFLMRAETRTARGDADGPGQFTPADKRTQAGEGAIRSTAEGAGRTGPGLAEWRFSWLAPQDVSGTVTLFVAAVAANDDASPLGDGVHLLQITGTVGPGNE